MLSTLVRIMKKWQPLSLSIKSEMAAIPTSYRPQGRSSAELGLQERYRSLSALSCMELLHENEYAYMLEIQGIITVTSQLRDR